MNTNLLDAANDEFDNLFDLCEELIYCMDDIDDYTMLRVLFERMSGVHYRKMVTNDFLSIAKEMNSALKIQIINYVNDHFKFFISELNSNIKTSETYKFNDYRCIDFIKRWGNLCRYYKAFYMELADQFGIKVDR